VIAADILAKKRDGLELGAEEIRAIIAGFLDGSCSEAQMAAFLMATLLRGMTARESADLTLAMVSSGETLDLSEIPGTKVDKHSTGGVGDKTTLVVAPLVAALGVPVPKMSGRSLGHTGGTIDKLEVIPGLTTDLSPERFRRQVAEIGVAIASQSQAMVPADKKIYRLRDTTATVESVPLIASSVMSKKLAAGADAIVLDVKVGGGAFMPDVRRARELGRTMVEIGRLAGKATVALITRMDQPIGSAVGDAAELAEAVATLSGHGPPDFRRLCEIVAGHMLVLGGAAGDPNEGRARARAALARGIGLPKLTEMVEAQGGSSEALDDPDLLLQHAVRTPVRVSGRGYVAAVEAREIGLVVRDLKRSAAARKHLCGVLLHRKVGDRCDGDTVATVLATQGQVDQAAAAAERVSSAFRLTDSRPRLPALLAGVVTA